MEVEQRNKQYNDYVKKVSPKSQWWGSLCWAFIIGGLICLLGEAIAVGAKELFPHLSKENIGAIVAVTLIFLASFFTALGLYDKLGTKAGGGTIVPITGFSNSVTSPAMEHANEGIIKGICAKMFIVAGPVIVIGVVGSIIVGTIYFIIGLV